MWRHCYLVIVADLSTVPGILSSNEKEILGHFQMTMQPSSTRDFFLDIKVLQALLIA